MGDLPVKSEMMSYRGNVGLSEIKVTNLKEVQVITKNVTGGVIK